VCERDRERERRESGRAMEREREICVCVFSFLRTYTHHIENMQMAMQACVKLHTENTIKQDHG
jgi:hypothetical protein